MDSNVCVLPATKPQLIAATLYFLASGRIVSNVLPAPRAIYSVQNQRTMKLLEKQNFLFEALRPSIVMEADYVRFFELSSLGLRQRGSVLKIDIPNAARERLRGMRLACPREHLGSRASTSCCLSGGSSFE